MQSLGKISESHDHDHETIIPTYHQGSSANDGTEMIMIIYIYIYRNILSLTQLQKKKKGPQYLPRDINILPVPFLTSYMQSSLYMHVDDPNDCTVMVIPFSQYSTARR